MGRVPSAKERRRAIEPREAAGHGERDAGYESTGPRSPLTAGGTSIVKMLSRSGEPTSLPLSIWRPAFLVAATSSSDAGFILSKNM